MAQPEHERAHEPEPTAGVTDFWQGLGLPGLFDVHVHFLPEPIQRKVWAQFDQAGPKIGRDWPIRYRGSYDERVELLRSFGVRRFSALPYAHKPGIAAYLNDWAASFAADVPECLWSATFYPEPEAPAYVAELVAQGVEVFKVHVQVGEFHLDDPLLDPVWGAAGGRGHPDRDPRRLRSGRQRVHRTRVPAPGAGALPAALRGRRAHGRAGVRRVPDAGRDATSAPTSTPRWSSRTSSTSRRPIPRSCRPRLLDLQGKVLLGSDFPTIPYPYLHQLEGLARLDLGDDWLRAVCWENGARLFGFVGAIA